MTYVSGESADHNREHSLKCEIAAETLHSFGLLRLRVTGHSMLPAIWPGDTLVIEQCCFGDIVPGDIVLYRRLHRLFAHRVLQAIDTPENRGLILQGDALQSPDAPVFTPELLGRVTEIVRAGQSIHASAMPTLATRCAARVLRYSGLLSRLLVHLHTKPRNSAENEALCQV